MKVIKVDFSKEGKDRYYFGRQLRKEQKNDIDGKIDRIIAYQDLKARGRLLSNNED